jgi:hypothetical protein
MPHPKAELEFSASVEIASQLKRPTKTTVYKPRPQLLSHNLL